MVSPEFVAIECFTGKHGVKTAVTLFRRSLLWFAVRIMIYKKTPTFLSGFLFLVFVY